MDISGWVNLLRRLFVAQITNLVEMRQRPIWVYDITFQVGPGKHNRRDDVALVQIAINGILRVKNLRDTRKRFNPGPDNPLTGAHHGYPLLNFLDVDGLFGPETANAIVTYQRAAGFVTDGVVDPVHTIYNPQNFGPTFRRTIYQLNLDNLHAHGRMLDQSKFPPFLQV